MLTPDMWTDATLILGAYLYGSIPFVWSIAHLRGINLRHRGSRSVGTANLAESAGAWAGALGFFSDFSKGVLPIVIGHYLLEADLGILCLAGLSALAGQMWPVWLKFFGGRGNSVSGGTIAGFIFTSYLPWEILVVLIPTLVAVVWRKLGKAKNTPTMSVPLASLIGFALVPVLSWLWGNPLVISFTYIAVLILLVIRRLTADISTELKHQPPTRELLAILNNRLLYDRSYRDRYQ